jgi:hypothetical protein
MSNSAIKDQLGSGCEDDGLGLVIFWTCTAIAMLICSLGMAIYWVMQ